MYNDVTIIYLRGFFLCVSADTVDDRDWSSLQKNTFDNMSDYLARKEERMRQKNAAKVPAETLSSHPSTAAKRAKLDP